MCTPPGVEPTAIDHRELDLRPFREFDGAKGPEDSVFEQRAEARRTRHRDESAIPRRRRHELRLSDNSKCRTNQLELLQKSVPNGIRKRENKHDRAQFGSIAILWVGCIVHGRARKCAISGGRGRWWTIGCGG